MSQPRLSFRPLLCVFLLGVFAAAGCSVELDVDQQGYVCTSDAECGEGFVCTPVPGTDYSVCRDPDAPFDAGRDAADAADTSEPTDAADAADGAADADTSAGGDGGDGGGASCGDGGLTCGTTCVDPESSVDHCGMCDNACVPPRRAGAECVSGACVYTCQAGFEDANDDLLMPGSDGCECEPTTDDEVACDGTDNDCDGVIDEWCPCDYQGNANGVCAQGARDGDGVCQEPDGWQSDETTCDSADNDCDGVADEGCACDYDGNGQGVCSDGTTGAGGGCQPPANWEADEASCDGVDNDCDSTIDEGCSCTDGAVQDCGTDLGLCTMGTQTCSGGQWGDCQGHVPPEPAEACDGDDNDCDGTTDEGCQCDYNGDPDGVCAWGIVKETDGHCSYPAAWRADEQPSTDCDGLDNDCDGITDEGCPCDYQGDPDGVCAGSTISSATGGCTQPADWEGAESSCDGLDNDCDGTVDDGVTTSYCHDADLDGFGNPSAINPACSPPTGYTTDCTDSCDGDLNNWTSAGCTGCVDSDSDGFYAGCDAYASIAGPDCDDTTNAASPDGVETCDTIDNDCDGVIDEGCDCSLNGDTDGVCAAAAIDDTGTCSSVDYETIETRCDGLDNDCDGVTDEDCPCNFNGDPQGVCATATRSAVDGHCQQPSNHQARETWCDSVDNDCDGLVDEAGADALTVGTNHACLLAGKRAFCWGDNHFGQLGSGIFSTDRSKPHPVDTTDHFAMIDAGANHTCATRDGDGKAFCWGAGGSGQLGYGNTNNRNAPTPVGGATSYSYDAVSAGGSHSCGIDRAGGTRQCWGANNFGQLGDGGASTWSSLPVTVVSPTATAWGRPKMISAGVDFTCLVDQNEAVFCWGNNAGGQLGIGTTGGTHSTPEPVSSLSARSLSAGRAHACATTNSGDAYCWGENLEGQLGDGTYTGAASPQPVGASSSSLQIDRISAGNSHTCAISNTSMLCWGQNTYGEAGGTASNNANGDVLSPQGVGSMAFVEVDAGAQFSCGRTQNGNVFCWGYDGQGQLGNGGPLSHSAAPVPVSCLGPPPSGP